MAGGHQYNGVLLCERPAQPPPPRGVFVVGRTGGAVGLGPSQEDQLARDEALRGVVRPKEETALTKHRKWLHQLERQSQARRQEDGPDPCPVPTPSRPAPRSASTDGANQSPGAKPSVPRRSGSASARSHRKSPPPSSRASKGKPKPQWALTEEEALARELAEGQRLSDFAAQLDFEEWAQDFEVQAALQAIREVVDICPSDSDGWAEEEEERRQVIEDVDRHGGVSPTPSRTSSLPAIPRRCAVTGQQPPATPTLSTVTSSTVQHDREWDISGPRRRLINAEALRLAERLLEDKPALRAVHSRQSLAKVLEELTRRGLQPPVPAAPPP